MTLEDQLSELGLHPSETKVYLFLIGHGPAALSDVSRETGITRTNCYYIFKQLQEKRLIVETIVKGKKRYFARDPSALVDLTRAQVERAQQALPELILRFNTGTAKPQIKFTETEQQLRTLFKNILEASFINYFGPRIADSWLYEKFYKDLLQKQPNAPNRAETAQIGHGLVLWDDNLTILNLQNPGFSTTISNKPIIDSFRVILGGVSRETNI